MEDSRKSNHPIIALIVKNEENPFSGAFKFPKRFNNIPLEKISNTINCYSKKLTAYLAKLNNVSPQFNEINKPLAESMSL